MVFSKELLRLVDLYTNRLVTLNFGIDDAKNFYSNVSFMLFYGG